MAHDLLLYTVAERDDPARELIGLRGTCDAKSLARAAPALIGALVEAVRPPARRAVRR